MKGLAGSAPPFVHLHVHSYYSFFASTLAPGDIAAWAAQGHGEGRGERPRAAPEPVGDMLAEPSRDSLLKPRETAAPPTNAPRPAIALTDTNAMTGIVEFYEAALAWGVKPILGLELTQPLAHERELLRRYGGQGRMDDEAEEEEGGGSSQSLPLCHGDESKRVVLLARNLDGYHELCRLATRRMLDPAFELLEAVAACDDHVVMLSDWPEALRVGCRRPKGSTYGLLTAARSRRGRNRAVYECAHRLGLPLAVGGDVRMAAPSEAPLLTLLRAMRSLRTLDGLPEQAQASPQEGWLRSAREIAWVFGLERAHALASELAQAMANTHIIAESCNCRLPLREWKFPSSGAPKEVSARRLRQLASEGLRWRYGPCPPREAQERVERELAIIEQLGFCDYFLLVHRIVEEARRRGFPTLGRGSAANSIVTYVLGISEVCPLRHGLCFERFLNPHRSSPPDIDLDFSWRDRDEMLRWCFEFFGEERVALVSTIQTLQLRQAVREVAKAYGLSQQEVDAFNRLKSVGYVLEQCLEGEAGQKRWERRHLAEEEPWRTVVEQARRLTGLPRHLSIHCGGVVIAPGAVSEWVGLTRSAKGFVITQMDMVSVEALGLVKMDLLSNRSLGVLVDTLAAVEGRGDRGQLAPAWGENERSKQAALPSQRGTVLAHEAARMKLAGTRRGTSVALAGILEGLQEEEGEARGAPPGLAGRSVRDIVFDLDAVTRDPATRRLIHEGRTMGCFYIESPGMRALFERLRCKEFTEVVAASSIIRPGVAESGMMEEYIARHRGQWQPHPRWERVQRLLRQLLPETHGVMVYQEDVLAVAHEIAGMSYGEADLLRRAMSGKTRSGEAMEAARERFVRGARERQGLTAEEAEELWRQVASFAGYSFCKGHSAAFAVLSYRVAFLKAHYPAEFFAAVLDNGGGFYGPGAYLEEARRWGLETLPPCVNEGDVAFRGETRAVEGLRAEGWVRVGLGAVQTLSQATCRRIVEQRQRGGVFRSVAEFLRRVRPWPHEARALGRAGALDSLLLVRPSQASWVQRATARMRVLLELELLLRSAESQNSGEFFAGPSGLEHEAQALRSASELGERVELSAHEARSRLCRWELETLGYMVSGHPLDFVCIPPEVIPAREIRRYTRQTVVMVGWAISAKELVASNSGLPLKMLSLEDRTDTFEAILFPRVYRRVVARTLSSGPYLLTGKVDGRLGSPMLEVRELDVLPLEWS